MRIFKLEADCAFKAENLDDALRRLALHFTVDAKGNLPEENFLVEGMISIEVVGEEAYEEEVPKLKPSGPFKLLRGGKHEC